MGLISYNLSCAMPETCLSVSDDSLVVLIAGWSRILFFFLFLFTPWMFCVRVTHFQTAVMNDSYVKFTWHHLSAAAIKSTLFLFKWSFKVCSYTTTSLLTKPCLIQHTLSLKMIFYLTHCKSDRKIYKYQLFPTMQNVTNYPVALPKIQQASSLTIRID